MKALLIVAGLFFSICGGLVAYFATSDPGHEYDLKLVLPIDSRQMPKPALPPAVVPTVKGTESAEQPVTENRAEAGSQAGLTASPPFQFEDRQGIPGQPRAQE